jgi:NAD(P)H dehydrogenase (quinone)
MIIVTGATGQLGGAVVRNLLTRIPADRIAVSVRDPGRAADLADRGVQVRRGDFAGPASLIPAFADATQVLLVSASATGEQAQLLHRTAIEAARDAGAGRIVYTGHMGVNPSSPFDPMRDHAATEEMLERSGVPFTSLRNGFYTSSARMLLDQALRTGRLTAPEDGPVSWTTHADLAEAAAIMLTEGGPDGPTPALTGPAALDLSDLAAIAADLLGRPITRTVVSAEEYRDGLVTHGVPAASAEMLTGLFAASRQGEFAAVDPALEKMLGRPPITARDYLAADLAG